jgi:rare lipoprotein A (peptidoglycan hydrolase)
VACPQPSARVCTPPRPSTWRRATRLGRQPRGIALVLAGSLALSACATHRRPAVLPPGSGAPLTTVAPGWTQTGMASWYGPGYHGKRTSSGERFDQDALTAAHATLPLGTRVRVTFLSNRKSVVVRINDRIPRRDRIIDLSRGAARAIGLIGPGTGRVRLEVVGS